MEVIEVTTGVYWVDIPAADLRILCGCPADAVKHLKQRGLIRRVENKGVVTESGPNAILLSDLPLQGGEFSNLAEFPVLQMLYRQGMLLPGHPNNTGAKPILIGRQDQIKAQMDYIHRGNYGLTSQDEIEATGVAPAIARDWMRIKLSFAFGRISPPSDLLDVRVLDNEPIELAKGVMIRRLDVNLFEISHDGQRVTLDLNLADGRVYQAPFRLGYRNLRREYFAVVHSGDGDGWDVHRPAMGSILMFQGRIFLIDTGPNLQFVLRALGIGIHEIDGIFHTHCHDDHFAGLTTLVRADHRVRYYATPSVRASVAHKLAALMGTDIGAFDDFFDVHDLTLDTWNDIEGLEVRPLFSPHPVETTILQFRALWENGWKTYAHYADISSFQVINQMVTDDPLRPGISAEWAQTIKQKYLEPADLKKVDIGGGLIHGDANDFRGDTSGRIILAHTARDLTLDEKEIGSGAPFGTVDVLIPALQEYPLRLARSYLAQYFPEVPEHQLRILLNHPLEVINPETILIRDGHSVDKVYLILTGIVESIASHHERGAALTAGAMVGELPVLTASPAQETVRAASFVTALVLPGALYATFVAHNGLDQRVQRMASMRRFFNRTWLLGEHLSSMAETRIAAACRSASYRAGQEINIHEYDELLLIKRGCVRMVADKTVIEELGDGDVIGVSRVLFGAPPFCHYLAMADTEVLAIPGEVMRNIPVTRWKMMELHNRRMTLLATPRGDGDAFPWLADYTIGVPAMDRQHQHLLELASQVARHAQNHSTDSLLQALDDLAGYSRQHFMTEEDMLGALGYKEIADHRRMHVVLQDELNDIRHHVLNTGQFDVTAFHHYIHAQVLGHIFREDSRYVRFISSAGEYIL